MSTLFSPKKALLFAFSRRFWTVVFTLIIALAVVVQLFREAFPLLDDYKDKIAVEISRTLNVEIQLSEIVATWEGLRPKVGMKNLMVLGPDGEAAFDIGFASMELSLLDSLAQWRWVWRDVSFDDFRMVLKQDSNGRWKIPGITLPEQQNTFNIDDPLDIFLFGRRVDILNSEIKLVFADDRRSVIRLPQISLDNQDDFHRVHIKIDVDNQADVLTAVIEARGDPRSLDGFVQSGYLLLKEAEIGQFVAAVGETRATQLYQQYGLNPAAKLDALIWFDGTPSQGMTFRGRIKSTALCETDCSLLPSMVDTRLVGDWQFAEAWSLDLIDPVMTWPSTSLPSVKLSLFGNVNEGTRLGISVAELDLGEWTDFFTDSGLIKKLPEKAASALSALRPSGQASQVVAQLISPQEGYVRASAYVENVAIGAFKNAPSAEGVNGHLYINGFDGAFALQTDDDTQVHFANIYDEAFIFQAAKGDVAWRLDLTKKIIHLRSGAIELEAEDHTAKGYFAMQLPLVKGAVEPSMTLAIEVDRIAAKYHRRYIPATVPQQLRAWLAKSVRQGQVTDAGFLFHGSVSKKPSIKPSIQLHARVSDAALYFDSNWPALEEADATIALDNRYLDIRVSEALLLKNRVKDTRITLINNPSDSGMALRINGLVDSDTGSAIALLKNSPVKSSLGNTIDSWQFSGNVSSQISLIVPLNENAEGTYQSVDVAFDNANIIIPPLDLTLNKVRGALNYSNKLGLTSSGFTVDLWGETLDVDMTTRLGGIKKQQLIETQLTFDGKVKLSSVSTWFKRPELQFVAGAAQVQGNMIIPLIKEGDRRFRINLRSDLKNVSIDLPEPIGKVASSKKEFTTTITMHPNHQDYHFTLDNKVALQFHSGKEAGGLILFGESPVEFEPGALNIAGNIDRFDVAEWNRVREKYFDYLSAMKKKQDSADEVDLPIRMDVLVKRVSMGALFTDDLRVIAEGSQHAWDMTLKNTMISGRLRTYSDDQPMQLSVDYLRLPPIKTSAEEESASSFSDINVDNVLAVDVKINELMVGENSYGDWRFDLRPVEDGIELQNISGKTHELTVVSSEASPAVFSWRRIREQGKSTRDESRFRGEITTKNLGHVFTAFNQPVAVESENAKVGLDLSWPGFPQHISLANVAGTVSLSLKDGSFIRGAEAGENPFLRLLALLNFDTFARRLRFDFSDLARKGFAFDSVSGRMSVNNGEIELIKPIQVKSSSSKMKMAGTVDMLNETLDTNLAVTLPFAGNLTLAAVVVASLPAAVGVYILSKLFHKQVDKVSSISYTVTGDWRDPKIEVNKLFSDAAVSK